MKSILYYYLPKIHQKNWPKVKVIKVVNVEFILNNDNNQSGKSNCYRWFLTSLNTNILPWSLTLYRSTAEIWATLNIEKRPFWKFKMAALTVFGKMYKRKNNLTFCLNHYKINKMWNDHWFSKRFINFNLFARGLSDEFTKLNVLLGVKHLTQHGSSSIELYRATHILICDCNSLSVLFIKFDSKLLIFEMQVSIISCFS